MADTHDTGAGAPPDEWQPVQTLEALEVIKRLAAHGMQHTSKDGQDFLEWIIMVADGADPGGVYEAARADYEDPEEGPWEAK